MLELQKKTPYLDLEECIARYPRLAASLAWAGFSITEAGAAIRDYRLGLRWSSEAIDHTGGTIRALTLAYKHRSYARLYQDPEGYSRRRIRAIRAEKRITLADARRRDAQRAAAEQARIEQSAAIEQARLAAYYRMRDARNPILGIN